MDAFTYILIVIGAFRLSALTMKLINKIGTPKR